jgi:hypothetical protein
MQLRVLFFAAADERLGRRRAGALAFASARGQFLFREGGFPEVPASKIQRCCSALVAGVVCFHLDQLQHLVFHNSICKILKSMPQLNLQISKHLDHSTGQLFGTFWIIFSTIQVAN